MKTKTTMTKNYKLLAQLAEELLRNKCDWGNHYASECTLIDDDVNALKDFLDIEYFGLVVHAVVQDEVCDYERSETTELFFSEEDAIARFKTLVKDAKENASEFGWDGWSEDETETSYETYPDGWFGENHYSCMIKKLVIK